MTNEEMKRIDAEEALARARKQPTPIPTHCFVCKREIGDTFYQNMNGERRHVHCLDKPNCLLTQRTVNVFITSNMRDEQPERTQELFDDVELALKTCETIARNIRQKYPFMRVEVTP